MTTVQQIYEEMQRIAPLALAESWDNPGLLVDCGGEVSRVLVTLDITPEVVEEAARKGCGLIVSHHPVIFSPLKKLSGQDVAFQLVKSGISAICMHTNLDAAEGGVNEVLAGYLWDAGDGSVRRGLRPCGQHRAHHSPRAGKKGAERACLPLQSAVQRPCGAGQVRRHRQNGAAAGRHQRRRRKPLRGRHCAGVQTAC